MKSELKKAGTLQLTGIRRRFLYEGRGPRSSQPQFRKTRSGQPRLKLIFVLFIGVFDGSVLLYFSTFQIIARFIEKEIWDINQFRVV